MSDVPGPVITKGTVKVVYAFDVGLSIDLSSCKQQVTDLTELARIEHKRHAPTYFQFDPPPLRVTQEVAPLEIGAHASTTSIDVVLFDFGGLSVTYTIPFQGTLDALVDLSSALTETTRFADDALNRVRHLMSVIESAVDRPRIAEMSEDYVIFQVEAFEPHVTVEDLVSLHAQKVARLLRAERGALSSQEEADVLASRVSFSDTDVALIDWNAALLYDRDPGDVRAVLEFANLQLLEMRFLDAALDRALDRSYELLARPRRLAHVRFPGRLRAELASMARMQVDGAILFERVNNALKLIGDQYLARVYRAATQRYRLGEWNTGALRKLETIESIYQKIHDHASGIRMEILEWIIIGLIAFEILLSLVPALSRA